MSKVSTQLSMTLAVMTLCLAFASTFSSGPQQSASTTTFATTQTGASIGFFVEASPVWFWAGNKPSPEEQRAKQQAEAAAEKLRLEEAQLKAKYAEELQRTREKARLKAHGQARVEDMRKQTSQKASNLVAGTQQVFTQTRDAMTSTFKKLNIPEGVLAGVGIATGLLLAFFGYKTYKPTLFLGGAGLGGAIAFVVLGNFTQNNVGASFSADNMPEWLPYVIIGVSALLLGTLAVALANVGLALLGGLAGSGLALFVLSLLIHLNVLLPRAAEIGIMAGCALLGATLIVWQKRVIIAVATAFGGAFLTFASIDAFVRTGFVQTLEQTFRGKDIKSVRLNHLKDQSHEVYGMMAGLAALFLVGLVVQLIISKRYGNAWSPRSKNPYAPAIGRSIYY